MNQIPNGQVGSGVPPDTIIARGYNRVLHLVNRRVRLLDNAGGIFATTDLNQFFGANSVDPTLLFDPKVIYDRGTQTYFAIALQGTTSTGPSRLYLTVSRPAVPSSFAASQWCHYWFNARTAFGGTLTWADFPSLGLGQNTLLVSTNQFTSGQVEAFQGTTIKAWVKNYYANNTNSCPAALAPYEWTSYGSGTRLPFTLQPTLHYTNPTGVSNATQPVYLIATIGGGDARYTLWKIANLAAGSPLLFGPTFIAGSISIQEPDRLAPGGKNNVGIDTGDTRMLQVAGVGNRLHGVHGARCQSGGGPNEVCVRYIQFAVGNTASGGIAVSVFQQTLEGGGAGWYYWFPSIAVNNSGGVAMAFNAAGIGGFRGSAWAAKAPSSSQFSAATWIAQGTCLLDATYDSNKQIYRAGDYSGAAADLDLSSIWVASERSVNITGVGCGWQTHIARISGF